MRINIKIIASMALALGVFTLFAQPLSDKDRRDFAEVTSRSCYTLQRGQAINKPVPDAAIKGYCHCYANKITERITVQDMQELFRIGQMSGAEAAEQELRRRFDVIGFASQCSAPYFHLNAVPGNSAEVFRDPSGDGMRIKDMVTCTFDQTTPDGIVVLFFPTSKGNLSAIPKNGSTGGKAINYEHVGTTDRGFYRVYQSGVVTVFTHRDNPVVMMKFNEDQFSGHCDKVIPRFMSE